MLSAKRTPAGKSGRIEVKIDTRSLSGTVEKLVSVSTNDPGHTVIMLSVKADVQPEIALSDSMIYFGIAPAGKEIRREILITLPAGKAIKVLSVSSTDQSVTVKLEPVPGSDGKKLRLIAIRKADARPGDHYGTIVLKTNSPLTPDIFVYASGKVGK